MRPSNSVFKGVQSRFDGASLPGQGVFIWVHIANGNCWESDLFKFDLHSHNDIIPRVFLGWLEGILPIETLNNINSLDAETRKTDYEEKIP